MMITEGKRDRDESTLKEEVEKTMFAKSFGSGNNLGDGVLKSNPNDKGLKRAKHDASSITDNEQACSRKQLKNDPSNTLGKVSAMKKTLKELGPKSEDQNESPKDSKLNLVGKILEEIKEIEPN